MEQHKLQVAASPHITSHASARKIMLGVIIALLPTLIAAAFIYGAGVLLLTVVTVVACVVFEALYCLIMKKPQPVGDLSAVVTGLILAFNLPPAFPIWMAIIGAFVAIVVAKQLFGGIGFNFVNPALVGRMVLQLSFTGQMINYTYPVTHGGVDALASATPLFVAQSESLPLIDMLLGTHGGVLGETCAVTLIIGGIFLIITRIISPIIPVVYIGGVFVLKVILSLGQGVAAGEALTGAVFTGYLYDSFTLILAGGLLLGAFFMATDYTTSPYTKLGKVIFGIGLAILTLAMREWSNMNEGVSYALLFMNLLVPYLNRGTRKRPLGVMSQKKEKADKAKGEAKA